VGVLHPEWVLLPAQAAHSSAHDNDDDDDPDLTEAAAAPLGAEALGTPQRAQSASATHAACRRAAALVAVALDTVGASNNAVN
jgi:hypothetical protein